MKFLTWILIFCFASQGIAGTVREGLESAMNDYEYDMVVEWDQKDAEKAEAITQKFTEKLQELYQQGLSDDELMRYVEGRVMDKNQLAAIRTSAALHSKDGTSAKNIAKALHDNMNKLGTKGASWTGGVASVVVITGLLAIAALIIYQLAWNLNHRCSRAVTNESCGEETTCNDYDYDEYGNSYCDSYSTSYSCSDVESCVSWAKF